MAAAIEEARKGIAAGQSPFGAVVVTDGRLIASGHNEVWRRTDPTAHAEVVAIKRAAAALGTIDLTGCTLYSTCEPCPMCAGAIHWARLGSVVFGASIADARRAGFNEMPLPIEDVYRAAACAPRVVRGVLGAECAALFEEWLASSPRAY
jgi:tRNA(Arg) A34 adenosine deaminase TadA